MDRRLYLIAAVALVVIAGAAVVVAARTDPADLAGERIVTSADELPIISKGPLPSLEGGQGWLNTAPLADEDLEGKVVLYDFWTYSCVNCVRTLPYLEAWHERYAADGLVVVGVHSPEFEFEKVDDNVAGAVDRLGVRYPVVFDDDLAIWAAFNNQYWPAKYLRDREGQLRYVHFGEGAYAEAEAAIRVLLDVPPDSPTAGAPDEEDPGEDEITPELYVGSLRGANASPESRDPGTRTYTLPDDLDVDRWALEGPWAVSPEHIQSVGDDQRIVLRYRGGEVNLVMDLVHDPVDVRVELDGEPVPPAARGPALTERDGETVARVTAADLYGLIAGGPDGDHRLTLTPLAPGLQAYAFTFGA